MEHASLFGAFTSTADNGTLCFFGREFIAIACSGTCFGLEFTAPTYSGTCFFGWEFAATPYNGTSYSLVVNAQLRHTMEIGVLHLHAQHTEGLVPLVGNLQQ